MNLKIKLLHLIILQLFLKVPELNLFFKTKLTLSSCLFDCYFCSEPNVSTVFPSLHAKPRSKIFVAFPAVCLSVQGRDQGVVPPCGDCCHGDKLGGMGGGTWNKLCKSSSVYYTGKMKACHNNLLCLTEFLACFSVVWNTCAYLFLSTLGMEKWTTGTVPPLKNNIFQNYSIFQTFMIKKKCWKTFIHYLYIVQCIYYLYNKFTSYTCNQFTSNWILFLFLPKIKLSHFIKQQ